jgi:hypothetical protein
MKVIRCNMTYNRSEKSMTPKRRGSRLTAKFAFLLTAWHIVVLAAYAADNESNKDAVLQKRDNPISREVQEQRLGDPPLPIMLNTMSSTRISTDGCHLAYATRGLTAGKATVVVDGRPGPEYDDIGSLKRPDLQP